MRSVKSLLLVGGFVFMTPILARAQGARTVRVLSGYQCMMLADLWDGKGPMPPPVPVFSGPSQSAQQVGIAGGTVIVPSPLRPIDGRTAMIFPNGRKVWIDVSKIVAWHSKADPQSICRPVLLSNGRYGTDGGR